MIFVDPHSDEYYRDRLFAEEGPIPEGEEPAGPLQRLRRNCAERNIELHTADYLLDGRFSSQPAEYYAFNRLNNYQKLLSRRNVRFAAFMLMEPPAVAPNLYRALPKLTGIFDRVYLHNTFGDGYSLKGVDQAKLRKLYWPQPYRNVLAPYWGNTDRFNRIVVINGNHIPRSFKRELYSKRIEAMADLAKLGVVDLYGRGWDKWWSYRSMWPPYWRNYKTLMSIYRGSCDSKYEVLSRYRFSLCFENMAMQGYLTEKIFDCLYAGTIPLYLGAPDISELVPADAFIDCRRFESWQEMWYDIARIPDEKIQSMKLAGRDFIEGVEGLKYYNSLLEIFSG